MRVLIATMFSILAGCSALPDSAVCGHCACSPGDRGLTRPVLCTTVRHDSCCIVFPSS